MQLEKEYKSVNELASEWGLTPRRIRTLCAEGKIEGAFKFCRDWMIPRDATRPVDGRMKNGEYVNWREKTQKGGD